MNFFIIVLFPVIWLIITMLSIFALKDFGPSQGKLMIFYDNGIRFPILKNSYTFTGLNM